MGRVIPLVVLAWIVLPTAVVGQEDKPKIRIERDVVFGRGGATELKLDLAFPVGDGPFPAVLCLHGGLWWSEGKRQDMQTTIEVLASRGYVAASIDYRLVPQARFPAPLEDCKTAVRWLRSQASRLGVDGDRIGVLGISSGAHLACLLGTTEPSDGLEGDGGNPKESSRVQAVVSFFGLTDLTRRTWNATFEERVLVPFLGETFDRRPELYEKASSVRYARAGAPPFLFFHGDQDTVIRPSQSRALAEKLQAAGVEVRLEILEGEGHGWKKEKLWQSIARAVVFLDTHLKRQ